MTASEYDDLKRFIEDYEPSKENTMTDETTLLPCPFCGGEAEFADIRRLGGWHMVTCKKCGALTQASLVRDKAIDAWNRRYTED